MKKTLSFIAIFVVTCACCIHAYAQQPPRAIVLGDDDTPRWHIGIHGGLSTTPTRVFRWGRYVYTSRNGTNGAAGAELGLDFGFDALDWLTIRLDVNWLQKNYRYDQNTSYSSLYCRYNSNYLNVPLIFDFNFGDEVRVHIMPGGYVGYWGNTYMMGNSVVTDPTTGYITTDSFRKDLYVFDNTLDNRFDGGLVLGLGLSVDPISSLRLSLETIMYIGLSNALPYYAQYSGYRYRNVGTLRFGVAYSF